MAKSFAIVASVVSLFFITISQNVWAGEQIVGAESSPAASPQKKNKITYYSGNARVSIEVGGLAPKEIHVSPGTRVIWVNDRGESVRVKFVSRAVSTTCEAPRGFVLGKKGIFESRGIKNGGVASLCFLEPQEYDYVIEESGTTSDTPQVASSEFRGRVIVRN